MSIIGNLFKYAKRQRPFFITGNSTASNATVSNSQIAVLAANANRAGATFVNTSANMCYIHYGTDAFTAGQGKALFPNGGTHEITESNLYQGVVTAIAQGGSNATLAIEED